MTLPLPLYTAEQTRKLDRLAIDSGIAGIDLMERAGAACLTVLQARWPECRRPLILCGAGNNAGDGYIIARLCREKNLRPEVLHVVDPDRLSGDAQLAAQRFFDQGGTTTAYQSMDGSDHDLIVDALLGTGLDRPLEGGFRDAVDSANRSGLPILAVDTPTGLGADTGCVHGTAARCAATVTFIGRKRGLFTGQARAHTGHIVFDDLQVPETILRSVRPAAELDSAESLRKLACRSATAHKGTHGRLLVAGGNQGMPGSVRLAGEAALRAGAGLVHIATHERHADTMALHFPPLMCSAVGNASSLRRWIQWADAVVAGPGLGTDDWASEVMHTVGEFNGPTVLDADGLNLIARSPDVRSNRILTPHPGEAARLLDTDVGSVEADRFAAAQALVENYGGVCVLKGPGTIVTDGNTCSVSALGNAGMATAGTGDALAGIIGALLAGGLSPIEAARTGVALHGRAGDLAAKNGMIGMTSLDLVDAIREAANGG